MAKNDDVDSRGSGRVTPVDSLTAAENEQRVGHTPGPWTFVDDEIRADKTHVVCFGHDYDDYGGIYARWPDPQDGPLLVDERAAYDAEVEANARLIAAAPDLLAIVRRVAEHFQDTDAPLGRDAAALLQKVEGR